MTWFIITHALVIVTFLLMLFEIRMERTGFAIFWAGLLLVSIVNAVRAGKNFQRN